MNNTSWENVGFWYQNLVGEQGHYYHRTTIMPGLLRLLKLDKSKKHRLLDLACGQGIASRYLPEGISYTGIDAAATLIQFAKKSAAPWQEFHVGDATKKLPVPEKDFSHAIIILALQNIEDPQAVINNVAKHLQPGGKFVIVLNHPCFRIPRQSGWGVDESKHLQFRRVDSYLSPMKIPIQMAPSKGKESTTTWSFHHPLSSMISWLSQAGFAVQQMEEWASDKKSTGKMAKMENRARAEIPLFMAIQATLLKS